MSMKYLYCRTGKVDVKWQTPHANVIENSERLANVHGGRGGGGGTLKYKFQPHTI